MVRSLTNEFFFSHNASQAGSFWKRLVGVVVFFWKSWLYLIVNTTTNLRVIHFFEIPNNGVQIRFQLIRDDAIIIDRTETEGDLCLLTLEETDVVIPVARSFDTNDWERSGGGHAQLLNPWYCTNRTCRSIMPKGKNFVLRSRRVPNESEPARIARFLESASFGPTRETVNSFTSVVSHLQDQMDLPPTYHREFFRRRLNVECQRHTAEFGIRQTPCTEELSAWRRSFLSTADVGRFVRVSREGDRWQLSVDGELRSMPLSFRLQQGEVSDGRTYKICSNVHFLRRADYRIIVDGRCRGIVPSDAIVSFPSNFTTTVIELPIFSGNANWMKTSTITESYILKNAPPSGCPNLGTEDQMVYGKTQDGEWFLFERLLDIRENSLLSPLPDGGATYWQQNRTEACSNVPRTFLNEDSCILSDSACSYGFGTDYAESTDREQHVVCGSPGEISNDLVLGDNWFNISFSNQRGFPGELQRQRELIWSTVVLKCQDQLRQRVAWALFQMFALPKSALENERRITESFVNYYDIFVRNAFTNFKDILREITYSPMMAASLSYLNSASIAYAYQRNKKLVYPDENFARELMQLFTIGLHELNDDGTPLLDSRNQTVLTYGSDEIESFAKIWTGFERHDRRANIEGFYGNYIDPLFINWEKRDLFPKSNLNGGFIGDGYPLCEDLPERAFLRIGAKYRVLGSSPAQELVHEENNVVESLTAKRLVLNPRTSQLYPKLCVKSSADRPCEHPSIVILDENLACDGNECVDTIRVVQVDDVFYEYIPNIPCVELGFYEDGVKLSYRRKSESGLCANPKIASAGISCCQGSADIANTNCVYAGERASFETSKQRCSDDGGTLCDYVRSEDSDGCPRSGYQWTTQDCSLAAKVNAFGHVAIVHELTNARPYVKVNSPSYFKVSWQDGHFPSVENNCGNSACEVIPEQNACLCKTQVKSEAVFSALPENSIEILDKLRVGHADPRIYDDGYFTQRDVNGYRVYTLNEYCCGMDSVFEVLDDNLVIRYYRNVKFSVFIPGSEFQFRNPVHFNSLVYSEGSATTAQHEVDALLNHLFFHRNTAPFVARHLIQRFGVSNPSPRYVGAVASAFRSGIYLHEEGQFGIGSYGDMAATIAAILTDRESRGQSLQGDPFHGSLREPIIKVVAFMRAMEFETSLPLVELDEMEEKIGEAPYEQQTVFSFFQSDYSPPGETSVGALAAPEAQVMSSGKTIGLLNGMFALIQRNDLSACERGFGRVGCSTDKPWDGLRYQPTQASDRRETLRELSLLLTSGRLSERKIENIYKATEGEVQDDIAWKRGLQLMLSTPEFHSTNMLDSIPQARTKRKTTSRGIPLESGYKAVIHLVLRGGCDSFNMLVPHPSCSKTSSSYKETRGTIALLDDDILDLGGDTSGQPCDRFGLHSELSLLKDLYDDGDLAFLANVGVMTKPVDKTNYRDDTETSLFAHNAMQEEVDKLDPFNSARGTGTLGRIADKVFSRGYRVGRTTVESSSKNLAGRSSSPPPVFTLDQSGVVPLAEIDLSSPAANEIISVLNGQFGGNRSGVYGELWSSLLQRSQNQTEQTYYLLQSNTDTTTTFSTNALGKRFRLISQLIAKRKERGVDRDFFFVEYGGWDHHPEVINALASRFETLNTELTNLVSELKSLGVWDEVAILETSEFSRTLTPNSGGGSDHAWGGNYFLASGRSRGKRIIGKYPDNLSVEGDLNIGRGRLIPTTPWDAIFNGIAQWMGADDLDLDAILPNRRNFERLYKASDLFR